MIENQDHRVKEKTATSISLETLIAIGNLRMDCTEHGTDGPGNLVTPLAHRHGISPRRITYPPALKEGASR